jgi:hypothetical protein
MAPAIRAATSSGTTGSVPEEAVTGPLRASFTGSIVTGAGYPSTPTLCRAKTR